jgi:ubiquinone/menaquinone biosynthesis C-methylase UbiE/aminoglycoside phosphotransferase (APT) family kinase protein
MMQNSVTDSVNKKISPYVPGEAKPDDLWPSDFACPRCAGQIVVKGDRLECSACHGTYPICHDIVDFRCRRHDYYFNPIPRRRMRALAQDAQNQPWANTIRDFLADVGQHPDWFDDLVVDARYAWKVLLCLPPEARVLDLGCGLGNLAKNLAPHADRTFGLDLTIERLEFTQQRFQKSDGSSNVTLLAGGDGAHLPFPDNSLDCVMLSGVLEWIATDNAWDTGGTKPRQAVSAFVSFFGRSNPRYTQIRFLKEIRRILKPEGQLFIAIENRFDYEYFGRRPDHHSGLWFASLLPRFVANLYSILIARRPYRTYTFSNRGHRRLLKRAGFSSPAICGLNPGYTRLAELIPFKSCGDLWKQRKQHGRDRIRRSETFVPAFGIIASKGAPRIPSVIERIASEIESQLQSGTGTAEFHRFWVTSKAKGIVAGQIGDYEVVVKLPFNDSATAAAERNYQFLQKAGQMAGLQRVTPRPVAKGEVQGVRYYAETYVRGRLLQTVLNRHNDAVYLQAISGILQAFNPELQERSPKALTGEFYRQQVLTPLEKVDDNIDEQALVEEIRAYFGKHLEGLSVRSGLVHGDVSDSNIFVGGADVTGVVDWEDIDPMGIPALDAINFVHSARRRLNSGAPTAEAVAQLATWDRLNIEEQAFLENSYRRCGVDRSRHPAFVCLYWLRHVADQLEEDLVYDAPALEKRVKNVFKRLLHMD